MTEFQQDTEETPVLFRKEKDGDTTAVFPCEPHDYYGKLMTCYAHIGQHSGCSFEWYRSTKPALPEEYADLKAELEGAPYGYKLKVYQRLDWRLHARFEAEVRRFNAESRRLKIS